MRRHTNFSNKWGIKKKCKLQICINSLVTTRRGDNKTLIKRKHFYWVCAIVLCALHILWGIITFILLFSLGRNKFRTPYFCFHGYFSIIPNPFSFAFVMWLRVEEYDLLIPLLRNNTEIQLSSSPPPTLSQESVLN